jgi:hypothetical protein
MGLLVLAGDLKITIIAVYQRWGMHRNKSSR